MDDSEAGAALCAPFLAQLPVAGVSISVVSGSGAQSTVGSSDAVAARLEELQLQFGEGPSPEAMRTGRPVLVPDVGAERARSDWPVFAPAAEEAGARALLSVPMSIGTVTVGVVSLYATTRHPSWTDAVERTASALAAAASQPAIGLAARSAIADRAPDPLQPELHREVHQAAGMAMVQLDGTIAEAMARLRARAFAEDRSLDVIAHEVVAGVFSFEDGND